MKLLLDMGLAPRTADFLHRLGHDADHIGKRGLSRLPDHDILALAELAAGAIIVVDPHRVRVRRLPIW